MANALPLPAARSPAAGQSESAGVHDSSSLSDPAFRERRIASYLKLQLAVFGGFWILDTFLFAWRGEVSRLFSLGHLGASGQVLSLLTFWQLGRSRLRSPALLSALDGIATLSVGVVALLVTQSLPVAQVAQGPLMGLAITLVVRAAIVPSSGARTACIGAGLTLLGALGYGLSPHHASFAGFAGVWLAAFTLVSSVVSRVIYGLQDEVRRARQLGQYVLEERLGQGGMGVVYRATHALLRRPTAVKLISRELCDERHRKRFEQEVRQTARLTHPHTVTVYDYGCTRDGTFYYAMELLEGSTLDDVVAVGGPLPGARVVHILRGVAAALAEAHGIRLIHRDIKPSNIMVCEQGGVPDTPKVLDFGLVKDLETNPALSQTGNFAGSPAFMSPEAIRAPEAVGPRSDLYALGAVGYFLLTGQHVFEGATVLEVCSHHLLSTPVPPSQRSGRSLNTGLEQLILRCLEKDPERRPPTAEALRDELAGLPGLGTWSDAEARRWWTEHGPSLARRRSGTRLERAAHTLTVAVDERERA